MYAKENDTNSYLLENVMKYVFDITKAGKIFDHLLINK